MYMYIKFECADYVLEAKFQNGIWYVGIEYADGGDCGYATTSFEEVIDCF